MITYFFPSGTTKSLPGRCPNLTPHTKVCYFKYCQFRNKFVDYTKSPGINILNQVPGLLRVWNPRFPGTREKVIPQLTCP